LQFKVEGEKKFNEEALAHRIIHDPPGLAGLLIGQPGSVPAAHKSG
jgi:hypothetical protein